MKTWQAPLPPAKGRKAKVTTESGGKKGSTSIRVTFRISQAGTEKLSEDIRPEHSHCSESSSAGAGSNWEGKKLSKASLKGKA